MELLNFIKYHRLKPIDAIVLRKKFMGMVDHYAIYLGNDEMGTPKFVANFIEGVNIISDQEIKEQLQKYVPERIERFQGSNEERQSAIERAWSKIGEKAYNLLSNNCEHFKNWVHYGRQISKQVDNAGTVLTLGGTATLVGGLAVSHKKATNWGVALLVSGIVCKCLAERKEG